MWHKLDMRVSLTVLIVLLNIYLVRSGPSFHPESALDGVDVWTNANAKWFIYPELSSSSNYFLPVIDVRQNFGVAVSGGGFRAVTLALGYVRALHMMNLTQQARFLSSNSGGSWFNAAFSYQSVMPVNTFLGPYVPPQDLSMGALGNTSKGAQGAFATTISEGSILAKGVAGAVVDVVTGSETGPGAWSSSVGDSFLKPYGLNADKSTITANGTKGPIHPALAQLEGIQAYTYQGNYDNRTDSNEPRPFPIILGTIFNRVRNTSLFYPIEFTPLYIGCPAVFPNKTNPNNTFGGGYVDPQGFNSAPPDPAPVVPAALATTLGDVPAGFPGPIGTARHRLLLQANSTAAGAAQPGALAQPAPAASTPKDKPAAGAAQPGDLAQPAPAAASPKAAGAAAAGTTSSAPVGLNADLPLQANVNSSFVVPLKVLVGISSSFLAQGLRPQAGALQELTGTEELDYWNQVNFKGSRQPFADGGGTDNLAITPLLRRGVANIVSCIAVVANIDAKTKPDDWAVIQWDIASLFGAVPLKNPGIKKGQVNGMSPAQLNRATQVFPKSGWTDMFKAFQSSMAAGGPAYHLATYTVLANPYQGIPGGQKVKVLWVPNALQKKWEALLPDDTQGTLAKSRSKDGGLFARDKKRRDAAPNAGKGMAELKLFPYISTYDANYSPELVGLLSQMATWQMLQLKPQLEKLVAGTKVAVAAPRNVGNATESEQVGKKAPPSNSAAGQKGTSSWLMAWLAATAAAAWAVVL